MPLSTRANSSVKPTVASASSTFEGAAKFGEFGAPVMMPP